MTRLLIFVVFMVAQSAGWAKDYPIQMHRPAKVGQQFRYVCQTKDSRRQTVALGQKTIQEQKRDLTVDLASEAKVLEVSPKGRITKITHQVDKLTRTEKETTTEILRKGAEIVAAIENAKVVFQVNGQPADAQVQNYLGMVIPLRQDDTTDDEIFGAATPKAPGDSWPVKAEFLAELLKKNKVNVQVSDIQGRTTFYRVAQQEAVEFLELSCKVFLKNLAPELPSGLEVKRAFGTAVFSGKYPTDLTIGPLEDQVEMVMDLTAQPKSAPGVTTPTMKAATSRTVRATYEYRK